MNKLATLQLTQAEFKRFQKFVYSRSGIAISDEKVAMLSNRLRKRLKALELKSFDEYYNLVVKCKDDAEELSHFLSAISTNETYFFRNETLWRFVGKEVIDRLVEANKQHSTKSARFWSAASSSGEEAYTLAMVLAEKLTSYQRWNIEIIGTDISQHVLNKATAGVYNEYAVQKMDPQHRRRHFRIEDEGSAFRVKDTVRNMVRFEFHNLRDAFKRSYFDVIFLRNVMMYFDMPMKRTVIKHVHAALKPGGLMITGDVDPMRASQELRDCTDLVLVGTNAYEKPVAQNTAPAAIQGVR